MIERKRFGIIFKVSTVLMALVALLGCGDQQIADTSGVKNGRESVGIATFSSAVDYAPLYIGQHFGWFETDSFSVDFLQFNQRSRLSDGLEEGTIDILLAAAPPVIITRAQGTPVKIFALSCTLRQEIAVQKASGIESIADLRGARVAVLSGTSSHYGLLNSLSAAGVSVDEVDIVFQGPGIAEANFDDGNIDAWAIWPPFIEKLLVADSAEIIRGGDSVIQSVIAVSEPFSNRNPELLDEITTVFNRAKRWMVDNPVEAQAIVARRLQLDPNVIELAWPKHDWSAVIDSEVKKDIESKIQFLNDEELLRDGWQQRIEGLWHENVDAARE